jgi:hypothetical protein
MFLDSLVTNVDEDDDMIEFEVVQKRKQRQMKEFDRDDVDSDDEVEVPERSEQVQTVPVAHLQRYVDLLSVETADNYEKWLKV